MLCAWVTASRAETEWLSVFMRELAQTESQAVQVVSATRLFMTDADGMHGQRRDQSERCGWQRRQTSAVLRCSFVVVLGGGRQKMRRNRALEVFRRRVSVARLEH